MLWLAKPVRSAFGVPLFEYLSDQPVQAARLFRAMSSISAARTACLTILRNCRNRLANGGRVVIIDIVLSDARNVNHTYRNFLELATLTQISGMERTESEFRTLLESAGFLLQRVIAMNAPQAIIEALPR